MVMDLWGINYSLGGLITDHGYHSMKQHRTESQHPQNSATILSV